MQKKTQLFFAQMIDYTKFVRIDFHFVVIEHLEESFDNRKLSC